MIEKEIVIDNRLGLHARAAAKFVESANSFQASVHLRKGNTRIDGKSILGLLTLAASRGTRLTLVVEGADEENAAEALANLIRTKFGEDE